MKKLNRTNKGVFIRSRFYDFFAALGILSPFVYAYLFFKFGDISPNLNSTYSFVRGIIELFYFITGSVVFIIAYFAYRQHKFELSKADQHSREYAHKLYLKYIDTINERDRDFSTTTLRNINDYNNRQLRDEFVYQINSMEALCAAFVDGLADLDTGEQLLAKSFCTTIDRYIPAMKLIWGDNFKDGCTSLFYLYYMWKAK